eukprot:3730769-Prymnesium_polylepis.2
MCPDRRSRSPPALRTAAAISLRAAASRRTAGCPSSTVTVKLPSRSHKRHAADGEQDRLSMPSGCIVNRAAPFGGTADLRDGESLGSPERRLPLVTRRRHPLVRSPPPQQARCAPAKPSVAPCSSNGAVARRGTTFAIDCRRTAAAAASTAHKAPGAASRPRMHSPCGLCPWPAPLSAANGPSAACGHAWAGARLRPAHPQAATTGTVSERCRAARPPPCACACSRRKRDG